MVPKYGRTAVARNRLKRRLRELVRVELLDSAQQRDVVIHASAASYLSTFGELHADIQRIRQLLDSQEGT